jgi:hypothetical protein
LRPAPRCHLIGPLGTRRGKFREPAGQLAGEEPALLREDYNETNKRNDKKVKNNGV